MSTTKATSFESKPIEKVLAPPVAKVKAQAKTTKGNALMESTEDGRHKT